MAHRLSWLPIAAIVAALAARAVAQGAGLAATDLPADVDRGQAVAVGAGADPQFACMNCHGLDGSGDAAAAFPRLAGQSFVYLYAALSDYAAGVRPHAIMGPIATALTPQQRIDAAAYYSTRADTEFAPVASADPLLLQLGGAIAAVGNSPAGVQGCINCHGPGGSGLGYEYPAIGGQHAAYLELRLTSWKAGASGGDPQGIMQAIAVRLSDEEIRAVAAYYAAQRPSVIPDRSIELPPLMLEAIAADDPAPTETR